jgi:sulfate transport system ATP-binding protein
MKIEVQDINKHFGTFAALQHVSVQIPDGQLVGLLGPSGSGKTTLLRIMAGLEVPDSGSILFDGEDSTSLLPRERRVGFVFQHYALFRHMTVFENIAFGLRIRPRQNRPNENEIRERVFTLLQLIQLENLAQRYPSQLSGGQRQRVALARALAVEPKVLLLDEPFGALDAKVRKELRRWLRQLHDTIHVTSVFVTHDVEEALEVADQIVVMNTGRVEQTGAPDQVYEAPANSFVCNFLGNVNLFHARVHHGRATVAGVEIPMPGHAQAENQQAFAAARPHDIEVTRACRHYEAIGATVEHVLPIGPIVRLQLRRTDTRDLIEAELSKDQWRLLNPAVGEYVYVQPRNIRVFVDDYAI